MRPRIVLVHDQEPFECFGIPEEAIVRKAPAPEPEPESRIPGSSRRDWVYREMALLGPDAGPWVEEDR